MTHFLDRLAKRVINPLGEKKRGNWQTPDDFFVACDKEFRFTLDVCANEKNHKVHRWLGPGAPSGLFNGLESNWIHETVWMNPPYNHIYDWMEKAYDEWRKSDGSTIVVCLVPVSPETRWWLEFATRAYEIRFVTPRIPFLDEDGKPVEGNPHPSALIIFRGDLYDFPPRTVYGWRWS